MAENTYNLMPGDILGSSGSGFTSGIINIGTLAFPGHGLSHVGIVACDPNGQLCVFESTSVLANCPENYCVLTNRYISGVQCHTIDHFLARGGKVWVYRAKRPLLLIESMQLTKFLLPLVGRSYDYKGCIMAGGGKLRNYFRQFICKEDLRMIYCSELVGSCVNLRFPGEFKNSSVWSPNALCRYLVSDGIYNGAERLV